MKRFLVITHGALGCDYSIGCGWLIRDMWAESSSAILDGMLAEVRADDGEWRDEIVNDDTGSITIYELGADPVKVDLDGIRAEYESDCAAHEEAERERQERAELHRLRAKYED